MPANKTWLLILLTLLLGSALGLLLWTRPSSPTNNALYCFENSSTVWSAAPRDPSWTPECPQSTSYKEEVQKGDSRVEQFRLSGWQPKVIFNLLRQAGYVQVEDEIEGSTHHSAFMGKGAPGEVFYTAVKEQNTTLITISGR